MAGTELMTILSDINEVWKSLSDNAIKNEGHIFFRFRNCVQNLEVWVGINQTSGQEEIKFSFDTSFNIHKSQLSQGGGFQMEVIQESRGTALYVEKKNDGNLQLFTLMISDVIQELTRSEVKGNQSCFELILRRIRKWQDFMRKVRSTLTLEEEIGIFGELCCLNSILDLSYDATEAVSAWQGPNHGIHDFAFLECDIEVKSTLAEEGFSAKILNQEQLEAQSEIPLWFCGYRLTRSTTEGSTLFELIEATRKRLNNFEEAKDRFEVLLAKAGWLDDYKNQTRNQYVLSENFLWKVNKTFPRIIPSSLMPGIISVNYQIDLTGRIVDANNMSQLFNFCGK